MTQHLGTQRKEFYSRNKVSLKLIPSADMATEYEMSDVRKREGGQCKTLHMEEAKRHIA